MHNAPSGAEAERGESRRTMAASYRGRHSVECSTTVRRRIGFDDGRGRAMRRERRLEDCIPERLAV